MGDKLLGKVAVITGSTSGIGRASAEMFAQEGASVVINGRRRELGEKVVDHIEKNGGTARYFYADVTHSDEVRDLVRFAIEEFGRLDILMNNAWSGASESVMDMTEEGWDAAFAATIKATVIASQEAIPQMKKLREGSIINVSSVHGVLADQTNGPYNTFKAGLINLSRQMAIDYGPYGIRVNALCPGRIVHQHKIEMLMANPDEIQLQDLVYPLRRPGTLDETAKAALFLASDDSSYVTGHALMVDGGLTAQLQDTTGRIMLKAMKSKSPREEE